MVLHTDSNLPAREHAAPLGSRASGTVEALQKISADSGGFSGTLEDGDNLGTSLASLGDVDGDGGVDLVR